MDVDLPERHLLLDVHSHHHHPGHPEEDDVEARDQHGPRVVAPDQVVPGRPVERRERPEPGREPGVEHVLVLRERHRLAERLLGRRRRLRLRFGDEHRAVGTVPRGNAVAPPELARDAPGLDVPHPFEVGVGPVRRDEAGRPLLDRPDRRARQRLRVDEPLVGEPRLDHRLRAVAEGDRVHDLLLPLEQAGGLQVGHHALAGLEAVEIPVGRRHVGVQRAVRVQDVDRYLVVPPTHLEVVEVVGRRDLDRARPLLRIDVGVRDDRDHPVGERQPDVAPHEVRGPRILRVHGDAGVPQHGLRAGGRHRDVAVTVHERIADVPEAALDLAGVDLEVRDRGAELRIPVHQPLVAVDQSIPVQAYEHPPDRRREALVQREALARPVRGRPEAAQLAVDRPARLPLPRPDPLDEGLAAERLPVRAALVRQLPLHHHLGGDPGMVGPRLPQHVAAAHAPVPAEDVLQRHVERVPDVEAPGDVGGRHHHDERILGGRRVAGERARVLPGLVDA